MSAVSRGRLRDQRGFFTGNLIEPLMCVPMLSILLLAAFLLLNDTMRSQARTRSQTSGYQHAQRAFDGVVRQLRTAKSITYQAPDQTMNSVWGSYGTGETNKIIANMVVSRPSSVGTAPRDVTYRCYYTAGGIQYPICTRAFASDAGTNYTCVIYPSGGVSASSVDSGAANIGAADGPCYTGTVSINNAVNQYSTNSNNDFAWVNYDVGVFQFVDSQGAAVDASQASVSPDALEFHPVICLKVPNCGSHGVGSNAGFSGSKRLLQLRTTIDWRNRPADSADNDPCNDTDTTNDPAETILNPDWPDQTPQSIPNPDACAPPDA